jgi:two-component system OmpR family sensor kinase
MDPAVVAHAFDQFYRAPDARRLAPDGSGVGLYAARGLVRAMGGDIRLESRLGAGTTVTLVLPAEEAAEDPALRSLIT